MDQVQKRERRQNREADVADAKSLGYSRLNDFDVDAEIAQARAFMEANGFKGDRTEASLRKLVKDGVMRDEGIDPDREARLSTSTTGGTFLDANYDLREERRPRGPANDDDPLTTGVTIEHPTEGVVCKRDHGSEAAQIACTRRNTAIRNAIRRERDAERRKKQRVRARVERQLDQR